MTTLSSYKNHRAGSRKAAVHERFDAKGPEDAQKYGRKRGLKESTLKQWIRTWGRSDKRRRVKR